LHWLIPLLPLLLLDGLLDAHNCLVVCYCEAVGGQQGLPLDYLKTTHLGCRHEQGTGTPGTHLGCPAMSTDFIPEGAKSKCLRLENPAFWVDRTANLKFGMPRLADYATHCAVGHSKATPEASPCDGAL
jgi:hypothetical protein